MDPVVDSAQEKPEVTQPVDGVPADTEEQAPAQGQDTEQPAVYVEGEGDQEQPKDESWQYAKWKEEKKKRREAAEKATRLEEQNRQLQERLQQVEQSQAQLSRGPRPQPMDFSTNEEFWAAHAEWEKKGQPVSNTATAEAAPRQQAHALTDDQEFHLYQTESALRSKLPDYDQAKEQAQTLLADALGADTDTVTNAIVASSHTFGVDPARIFFAIAKLPRMAGEIARNKGDAAKVRELLVDLERKVKVRDSKPADTRPEPVIHSRGPIEAAAAAVKKAQEDYNASPTLANHTKLREARAQANKVKQNG